MADNIIALIPEQAPAAYEVLAKVRNSDDLPEVKIYGAVVLETDAEGQPTVQESYDPYEGSGPVAGGLLGALVGVLGGPLGVLLGATAGSAIGAARQGSDEIDAFEALPLIAQKLGPSRTAAIILAAESDDAPLDALGSETGSMVVRGSAAALLDEVQQLQDVADDEAYKQAAAERAEKREEFSRKAEDTWEDFKAKFTGGHQK
ncbi:hypothetical protein ODZ83_07435 [Acaricomes phytoseiuli]|uniref:hypothetical protein n=1 Tax=Acaricomes phytoseiuli TaxID=291968 RepID=UPI000374F443|nr:hypothetical protein [Acaricomes phytoseiuli]MCW1250015.1 hypothetical protein [Acaricomes phytoseiuli]